MGNFNSRNEPPPAWYNGHDLEQLFRGSIIADQLMRHARRRRQHVVADPATLNREDNRDLEAYRQFMADQMRISLSILTLRGGLSDEDAELLNLGEAYRRYVAYHSRQ